MDMGMSEEFEYLKMKDSENSKTRPGSVHKVYR